MPTYEYKCEKCNETFEEFHSITDKAKRKKCIICGGKIKRLIGAGSALIFIGDGFYINENKRRVK